MRTRVAINTAIVLAAICRVSRSLPSPNIAITMFMSFSIMLCAETATFAARQEPRIGYARPNHERLEPTRVDPSIRLALLPSGAQTA
ncbi:protein of unknown function [Caballeronia sp. S22]